MTVCGLGVSRFPLSLKFTARGRTIDPGQFLCGREILQCGSNNNANVEIVGSRHAAAGANKVIANYLCHICPPEHGRGTDANFRVLLWLGHI